MVQASCLAWIVVDTESREVVAIRIQGTPENLSIAPEPDVLADDPHDQPLISSETQTAAIQLAATGRRPMPFEIVA